MSSPRLLTFIGRTNWFVPSFFLYAVQVVAAAKAYHHKKMLQHQLVVFSKFDGQKFCHPSSVRIFTEPCVQVPIVVVSIAKMWFRTAVG